jgi:FG-GAP-like repeat
MAISCQASNSISVRIPRTRDKSGCECSQGLFRSQQGKTELDGDGDLDAVVVSFLPAEYFPQRDNLKLDSVVLLEQTARGQFTPHSLETARCDHLTCAVGDVDGDGKVDLVLGNFVKGTAKADAVEIWRNVGSHR